MIQLNIFFKNLMKLVCENVVALCELSVNIKNEILEDICLRNGAIAIGGAL